MNRRQVAPAQFSRAGVRTPSIAFAESKTVRRLLVKPADGCERTTNGCLPFRAFVVASQTAAGKTLIEC
jgi:hypothetical protein